MTVAEIFGNDFASYQSAFAEFPVTTMSRDLARAIGRLPDELGRPMVSGLDVGTGSGLHAAAMAVAGVRDVLGIDVSKAAIAAAEQRFLRLREQFDALAGRRVSMPRYAVCDMTTLVGGEKFDLVVANPPSFFPVEAVGIPDVPIESALFDGDRRYAYAPGKSFLYQLFATVIRNALNEDGIVLCSWPAIESRIADDAAGALVHPLTRLGRWFGLTFDCEERAPETFFRKIAHVTNYGRDDGLLEKVAADIGQGGIYSASMRMSEDLTLTFRYGLLCLRRELGRSNRFRVLDI